MKFVIVVPTFNEAGNVERLVRSLQAEFKLIPNQQMEILLVDDSSTDGTTEIIRKLQTEFTGVHLLLRKVKEGLGAAYAAGIKHALEVLRADVILEMDADFQHDPKDVKRFVVQIDGGADYVIGSRFIKGGSIPKDWQLTRKFLSIFGNLFARSVLALPGVTDYTTGFKASRVRGFLDRIDLDHLASKGFAYKLGLLAAMVDRGAKVKEIPITFANRDEGVSKMTGNDLWDSLVVVTSLRIKRSQKVFRFLAVGFLGLLINFIGLRYLVESFRLHPALANLLSAEVAIVSNFYLNNRWTFADRRHKQISRFLKKLLHFNLTSVFGIVFIQSGLILLLTYLFGQSNYLFHFFVATFFLVIFNFTIYNKVIWRPGD